MNFPCQCFFLTLITVVGKQLFLIVLELRFAFVRKIAKILAAQSSAQPLKNSCGASAMASEIVAPQVLTSDQQFRRPINRMIATLPRADFKIQLIKLDAVLSCQWLVTCTKSAFSFSN